jgi:uncharacterized protein YycO
MCNVLNLLKIICAKQHMRVICDKNIQNLKNKSTMFTLMAYQNYNKHWYHIGMETCIDKIVELLCRHVNMSVINVAEIIYESIGHPYIYTTGEIWRKKKGN